mgnify:CR=1 FL=1
MQLCRLRSAPVAEQDRQVGRIEGMLNNPGFTGKAPAEVIDRERTKLADLQAKRAQLAERLADM